MKDQILRIENLLLLVPILISGLAIYILIAEILPDDHVFFGGTAKSAEVYLLCEQIIQCLFMVLPGYLIHYFLRTIRKRNRGICFIHVIATILSLTYWTLQTGFAVSVVPGWHTTIYPPLFSDYMWRIPMITVVFFWILQLAFVIYGLIVIHRWRKSMS